jgi:hypothetical protein
MEEQLIIIQWEVNGDKLMISVETEEGTMTHEIWKGINPDDYGEMEVWLDENGGIRSSKTS